MGQRAFWRLGPDPGVWDIDEEHAFGQRPRCVGNLTKCRACRADGKPAERVMADPRRSRGAWRAGGLPARWEPHMQGLSRVVGWCEPYVQGCSITPAGGAASGACRPTTHRCHRGSLGCPRHGDLPGTIPQPENPALGRVRGKPGRRGGGLPTRSRW